MAYPHQLLSAFNQWCQLTYLLSEFPVKKTVTSRLFIVVIDRLNYPSTLVISTDNGKLSTGLPFHGITLTASKPILCYNFERYDMIEELRPLYQCVCVCVCVCVYVCVCVLW